MALRRRICGCTVAWILLLTQLIHAPVRYGRAFHLLASSTTTTRRKIRRPAQELGMIMSVGDDEASSISCCHTTTRQRRSARIRADACQRIRWNAIGDDCHLKRPRSVSPLRLSAKSSDDADKDATSEAVEPTSVEAGEAALSAAATDDDDDVSSSGVTRTLLLAIPLFCKFVLVLMIKFVTDLIVYPLLLLYRSARIAKRKVLRLIYGDSNSKNNNNSRGGASSGGASVNGAKP